MAPRSWRLAGTIRVTSQDCGSGPYRLDLHIPRYIPGFDVYVWLDADCWVQDGFALQQIVDATAKHPVAAVSYGYPGYRQILATAPNAPGVPHSTYFSYLFSQLLEPDVATPLHERPFLAGGVFAASAASPLWSAWQRLLRVLYPRARIAKPPIWKKFAPPPTAKTIWKGAVTNTAMFHADEVALTVISHLQVGGTLPS